MSAIALKMGTVSVGLAQSLTSGVFPLSGSRSQASSLKSKRDLIPWRWLEDGRDHTSIMVDNLWERRVTSR